MSWLLKLEKAKAEMAEASVDPWRIPLERVRGKIDYDGLERVSSQTLLDILEVPQRSRTAGTYRHLAKLIPIRVARDPCAALPRVCHAHPST